jgi:hypothetical protein
MPYKNRIDLYKAQKRHRVMIRQKLLEFLSDKKCTDCFESDPIVLDFDHRDRPVKFKAINKMLSGHYGWNSIMKEIGKCDIRCANCHRRKTYHQLGGMGKTKPL